MINTKDQEQLFKLIVDYLEEDIECIAIGGTAMMFSGYKTATKDIDLVFKSNKDRNIFIKAIEKIGYKQKSLLGIYDEKRKDSKNKPLLFSRGDERFDLFVKNVFGFNLDFDINKIIQRNDFLGKKELIVYVLPKEDLILLKSITSRERDYEDIETIINTDNEIDWDYIINEAIKQKKNNSWILIDLEETLQKLKTKAFIPDKYFKRIYKEQKK
ncbi:MAG: DUF6036 family nucleotidyltransferase [Candidatus Woesearchaeota archaeon]